jgi:hypothetical protein
MTPTNGMYGLFLAGALCDKVTIFGFLRTWWGGGGEMGWDPGWVRVRTRGQDLNLGCVRFELIPNLLSEKIVNAKTLNLKNFKL